MSMTAAAPDGGWRQVDSGRAQWTWGDAVRLASVGDRVTLVEEDNRLGSAETLSAVVAATEEIEAFVTGAAPWPSWIGVVQRGGRRRWDPLLTFTLELYLVSDEFTTVLERKGLTQGWTTVAIPVFDADWKPVDTHRALVVSGFIHREQAVHGTDPCQRSRERSYPDLPWSRSDLRRELRRSSRRHGQTLVARNDRSL
jgi:hypothetical protein